MHAIASASGRSRCGAEPLHRGLTQRHRVSVWALHGVNLLRTRAASVLVLLVAGWPVLRWYVQRLSDGSDEPLGLVPLALALGLVPRTSWSEHVQPRRLYVTALLLGAYALSYAAAPPLGHALLWVFAVAVLLAPRSFALAWSALLVLALPLVATVQFYLGYPMRSVTTVVAAALLRMAGLRVVAEGTVLRWSGERVLIDAPCAGIQMLWTLLLATAVLASFWQLGNAATLRLFRWSVLTVFLSNLVRAVTLFCMEERIIPALPGGHESVGLGLFGIATAVLLVLVRREQRIDGGGQAMRQRSGRNAPPAARVRFAWRYATRICFSSAVLAASSPWIQGTCGEDSGIRSQHVAFPGWTAAPIPPELTPIRLGEREQRFAKAFPGKIAAFSDGRTTWVVRWVEQPTRKLHPAADCLRGAGYTVIPGSAVADRSGALWAGSTATRGRETLRVQERIFAERETSGWTDVSAWYWNAVLQRTSGPWWAITQIEVITR